MNLQYFIMQIADFEIVYPYFHYGLLRELNCSLGCNLVDEYVLFQVFKCLTNIEYLNAFIVIYLIHFGLISFILN